MQLSLEAKHRNQIHSEMLTEILRIRMCSEQAATCWLVALTNFSPTKYPTATPVVCIIKQNLTKLEIRKTVSIKAVLTLKSTYQSPFLFSTLLNVYRLCFYDFFPISCFYTHCTTNYILPKFTDVKTK